MPATSSVIDGRPGATSRARYMFTCMGSSQWALAEVFRVVSDAAGDRDAIVWGDRRQSYANTRARTDGLAAYLISRGFGRVDADPSAPRWVCPQDRVAVLQHNRP